MKIGQKIKLKREQIGLSVDELAEILGKNRATIYRYKSSEIEKLPTTVLEPLAKALKTTPAYLMGWEDDKPADTLTVLPQDKIHMIPVFGSVAAGFGAYASHYDNKKCTNFQVEFVQTYKTMSLRKNFSQNY